LPVPAAVTVWAVAVWAVVPWAVVRVGLGLVVRTDPTGLARRVQVRVLPPRDRLTPAQLLEEIVEQVAHQSHESRGFLVEGRPCGGRSGSGTERLVNQSTKERLFGAPLAVDRSSP
jgi:hypothetical protein